MAIRAAGVAMLALLASSPAQAQRPRWAGGVHEIATARRTGSQSIGLYRLAPGHYVYPGEGPTYWSPHFRPFPDYSGYHRGGYFRGGRPFSRTIPWRSAPWYSGPSAGYSSFYGYSGYYAYYGNVESAYDQGRFDAQRDYFWYTASQRATRLLSQHAALFSEGVSLFREGNFDQAVVRLLGAAESNQSDAGSRLFAGHALFALGRYADAVEQLARAFELSPSLAYKGYDLRDQYGKQGDFDKQLAVLRSFAAANPNAAAAQTMLGYVLFFTDGPAAALPFLERAARLDPKSYFIPRLLGLARKASPATSELDASPRAAPANQVGRPAAPEFRAPAKKKPDSRRASDRRRIVMDTARSD